MGIEVRPLIILTATVAPSISSGLFLSDPRQRREEYRVAAQWWSEKGRRLGLDILVAENSGDDIDAWMPPGVVGLRCPESVSPELGKGSGEVSILRAALAEEGARLRDRPWVAKCTGRLTLANPVGVLPRRSSPSAFVSCRPTSDLSEVDARFVAASPSVWKDHLLAFTDAIDDRRGHYLEHAFARGTYSALLDGVAFVPFRQVPRFRGTSGTSGLKYDSFRMRLAAVLEDGSNAARSWGRRRL